MTLSAEKRRASPRDKTRAGSGEHAVHVELDAAQVNHVIRGAARTSSVAVQLSGTSDAHRQDLEHMQSGSSMKLSRSLVLGLLTYAAFPEDGSYVRITDIARDLQMRSSTAHRYISTLLAVGLIERDPRKRLYRLVR